MKETSTNFIQLENRFAFWKKETTISKNLFFFFIPALFCLLTPYFSKAQSLPLTYTPATAGGTQNTDYNPSNNPYIETFTWTSGISGNVEIQCWAAGAGGDGADNNYDASPGGGGGGYAMGTYTVTSGNHYLVIVGVGGGGGAPGNGCSEGQSGGNSYFCDLSVTTGTITTSTGSATVTGSGTSFMTQLVAGSIIFNATTGAYIGTVASTPVSNTSLTLVAHATQTHATGIAYATPAVLARGGDATDGYGGGTTNSITLYGAQIGSTLHTGGNGGNSGCTSNETDGGGGGAGSGGNGVNGQTGCSDCGGGTGGATNAGGAAGGAGGPGDDGGDDGDQTAYNNPGESPGGGGGTSNQSDYGISGASGGNGQVMITSSCSQAAPVATTGSGATATSPTAAQITANWNTTSGAVTYNLSVSINSNMSSPVVNALNVGNVLTYTVTGLTPNTTYYYQVSANSATCTGGGSNIITYATPPFTIQSNGTGGGNWSVGSSWVGGVAPTSAAAAVIVSGDVITIDANSDAASAITVNSGGTLEYPNQSTSVSLTVTGTITVSSGGTFEAYPIPTVTGVHTLFNASAISNSGTVNFNITSGIYTSAVLQNGDFESNASGGQQWATYVSASVEHAGAWSINTGAAWTSVSGTTEIPGSVGYTTATVWIQDGTNMIYYDAGLTPGYGLIKALIIGGGTSGAFYGSEENWALSVSGNVTINYGATLSAPSNPQVAGLDCQLWFNGTLINNGNPLISITHSGNAAVGGVMGIVKTGDFVSDFTANGTDNLNWTSSSSWLVYEGSGTLTGTITTTSGSTAVTGSGTSFTTQLAVGSLITNTAGVYIGTVKTVNSATSITLAVGAASSNSGIAYNTTGVLVPAASGQYPGCSGAYANPLAGVTIANGTTVTIDNTLANPITYLWMNTQTTNTGTITTTAGSTAVTGSLTTFQTQLGVGSIITTAAGVYIGTVASITSNTALVLTTGGAASSNSAIAYGTGGVLQYSNTVNGISLTVNGMIYVNKGSIFRNNITAPASNTQSLYAGSIIALTGATFNLATPYTNTGTITTTAGSTAVTGSGTSFTTQLAAGSIIETTAGVYIGTVSSVTSNTALVLTTGGAASSNSGIAYATIAGPIVNTTILYPFNASEATLLASYVYDLVGWNTSTTCAGAPSVVLTFNSLTIEDPPTSSLAVTLGTSITVDGNLTVGQSGSPGAYLQFGNCDVEYNLIVIGQITINNNAEVGPPKYADGYCTSGTITQIIDNIYNSQPVVLNGTGILATFSSGSAIFQNGDFRSTYSGAPPTANWSATGTWQYLNGAAGWVAAPAAPGSVGYTTVNVWIQGNTVSTGTGTITSTAGSTAVTGSSTSFTTQLSPGSKIYTNASPPVLIGTVASVTNATALVLTAGAAASHSGIIWDYALSTVTIDGSAGNPTIGSLFIEGAVGGSSCNNLEAGTLQFTNTGSTNETLTVSGNVKLLGSGATLQAALFTPATANLSHTLSIGGNLYNYGTVNLQTVGNANTHTAQVATTFTGSNAIIEPDGGAITFGALNIPNGTTLTYKEGFTSTGLLTVGGTTSGTLEPNDTINTAVTGTITTTAGSTAVTGSGTSFTTQLAVGGIIQTTAGVYIGTVSSVTSNTALVLTTGGAASSNSGIAYASAASYTITADGGVLVNVGGTFESNQSANATHILNVAGNIVNNGTINFTNTSGTSNINVTETNPISAAISTTSGNTAVTGSGTLFTTELSAGSVIQTSAGVILGTVASITDDVDLTLTSGGAASTYAGAYTTAYSYSGAGTNTFHNFTQSNTAASPGYTLGANMNMAGILTITGSCWLGLNGYMLNMTNNNSSLAATLINTTPANLVTTTPGSILQLNSSGAGIMTLSSGIVNIASGAQLLLTNTGTYALGTPAIKGTLTINNNPTLSGGTPSFGSTSTLQYTGSTAHAPASSAMLAYEWSTTSTATAADVFTTGTIITSTSSATVTGINTLFLTELTTGSILYTTAATPVAIGTVSSIQSNTSLTLTGNAVLTNATPGIAYLSGVISIASGSATVTGTGTYFTSQLSPGSTLYTTGGVLIGTVLSIQSNTSLTLTANNATTAITTKNYEISGPQNIVINNSGGFTLPGSSNRTIGGDLYLQQGAFTMGANTLTLNGFVTNSNGSGTITTSSSSTAVTGAGTSFTTQFATTPAPLYTTAGVLIGTVTSVTNNTFLTLTANAASTNTNIDYVGGAAGNGTITGASNSTISIGGSGNLGVLSTDALTFTSGSQNLASLNLNRLNNPSGQVIGGQLVNLGSALTVGTTLTLTQGILNLGSYNLTLSNGTPGSQLSPSATSPAAYTATNMIQANGTGSLIRAIKAISSAGLANNVIYTYPVGDVTTVSGTGTITTSASSTAVTGSGTAFNTQLVPGDVITTTAGVYIGTVSSIGSGTSLTLTANAGATYSGISFQSNMHYSPATLTFSQQDPGGTVAGSLGVNLLSSYSYPATGTYSLPANTTNYLTRIWNFSTVSGLANYNYNFSPTIASGTAATGTITTSASSTAVTGTGTAFNTEFVAGDILETAGGVYLGTLASTPGSGTSLTLTENAASAVSGVAFQNGGTAGQENFIYNAPFDKTGYAKYMQLYSWSNSSTAWSLLPNSSWDPAYVGTSTSDSDFVVTTLPNNMGANYTGTISTSTSSAVVTGSGTAFTTQLAVGTNISTTAGAYIGTVLSIASTTSLTLTANAASTNSGINYQNAGYETQATHPLSTYFTAMLAPTNTITTSNITGPLCSGSSVTVNFTATGTYTGANVYTAQLSNSSGSFSSPVTIGTLTSTSNGSLSITANPGIIPANATTGSGYLIRVVSSVPVVTGSSTAAFTITAAPTASISYSGTPFCSTLGAGQLVTSSGTNAYTGGTYSAPGGLTIDGSSGAINPSTSTAGPYTVTYNTPAAGGCAAVPATTSVIITTLPVATFSYTGSPYCSNASNPLPTFSGGGVAGLFSSTAGLNFVSTATGQLNLATSTANSYTVMNTIAAAGGCAQVQATSSVTINPVPNMTSSNTATTCSGTALNLGLTSDVTSSYSWSATENPNTTGESLTSQSGSTINDNITNNVTSPQNVVYSVIPISAGCVGATQTVTVTANPIPTASAVPSNPYICSGTGANITLTNNTTGGTNSWTWTGTNGTNISGAGNSSGSPINQTLTNSDVIPQTATYVITPTFTYQSVGCTGSILNQNVTVNPLPTVTAVATPSNLTICSFNAPTINLSNNTTGGTNSWTWTATNDYAYISGAISSTGNLINQTLTNSTNTSNGTATYVITPVFTNNVSCNGSTLTQTVTVMPLPAVSVSPTDAVCTGQTNVTLTASGNSASYTWAPAAFLNTTTGNTVTTQISVVTFYTVTGTGSNGCTANGNIVPVATVPVGGIVTPTATVICSGGTTTLTCTNAAGHDYQWQISPDNVNWSNVSAVGATNATYTTQASDGGITEYYRQLANSNACYDIASTTAIVSVSATPVITVTNITSTTVTVTWTPYGSGQYNISWSGAAGSGSANGVTSNTAVIGGPNYLPALTPNASLTVTVTPVGSIASPVCGGVLSSTTPTINTLCGSPTITNVSPTAFHGFVVDWDAVTGATAYRVYYRDLSSSSTWSFTDVTGTTTATITVLYGGHTFAVYVAAKDCPSTGDIGDASTPMNYVTTLPLPACGPPPTVLTVSNCPNQITVSISGSGPPYNLILRRISPSLTNGVSYPISTSAVNVTVGTQYAGSTWEIFATQVCGPGNISATSNISDVTVKPGCPIVNNLVLSHPTCNGFTASWNTSDCAGLGISKYEMLIKRSSELNYAGYPVSSELNDEVVSWEPGNTTYDVVVMAVACNDATSSYSNVETISSLNCGREGIAESANSNAAGNTKEAVTVYPNPAQNDFNIDIGRTDMGAANVTIELINQLGQVIQTNITQISGGHLTEIMNVGDNVASGLYFVRTYVGGNVYVNRIVISRE